MEDLINIISKTLNVELNDVINKTRCKQRKCGKIHARHIAVKILKDTTPLTYAKIALLFNRRLSNGKGDHSFSIYAEYTANQLLKNKDKEFTAKYNLVLNELEKNG